MPIISVEPRICCVSSARLTPPIAATSLISSSPLRPTKDDEKFAAFFSLDTMDPLMAALTFGAAVERAGRDKDGVVVAVAPMEAEDDDVVVACGKVMVKEMGGVSVEELFSVLIIPSRDVCCCCIGCCKILLGCLGGALLTGCTLVGRGAGEEEVDAFTMEPGVWPLTIVAVATVGRLP